MAPEAPVVGQTGSARLMRQPTGALTLERGTLGLVQLAVDLMHLTTSPAPAAPAAVAVAISKVNVGSAGTDAGHVSVFRKAVAPMQPRMGPLLLESVVSTMGTPWGQLLRGLIRQREAVSNKPSLSMK